MTAMYIERLLAPLLQKDRKSILLLGPRQTGKSTLIKSLNPDLATNLADEQIYLDFARNPAELKERILGKKYSTIFIDEVQRLPSILNTLQAMMDDRLSEAKFYLTGPGGSSGNSGDRGSPFHLPR